jgi:hypothetical protein
MMNSAPPEPPADPSKPDVATAPEAERAEIGTALRNLPTPEPPPSLLPGLRAMVERLHVEMQRTKPSPEQGGWWWQRWPRLTGASAFALVLGVAVLIGFQGEPPATNVASNTAAPASVPENIAAAERPASAANPANPAYPVQATTETPIAAASMPPEANRSLAAELTAETKPEAASLTPPDAGKSKIPTPELIAKLEIAAASADVAQTRRYWCQLKTQADVSKIELSEAASAFIKRNAFTC